MSDPAAYAIAAALNYIAHALAWIAAALVIYPWITSGFGSSSQKEK